MKVSDLREHRGFLIDDDGNKICRILRNSNGTFMVYKNKKGREETAVDFKKFVYNADKFIEPEREQDRN